MQTLHDNATASIRGGKFSPVSAYAAPARGLTLILERAASHRELTQRSHNPTVRDPGIQIILSGTWSATAPRHDEAGQQNIDLKSCFHRAVPAAGAR